MDELLELINHERSNIQRCWRMILAYGWVLFSLLLLSNALCISWVEGRMFASVGAYSRYLEMNSAKQVCCA